MKKTRFIYFLFLIVVISSIFYGVNVVRRNVNAESGQFSFDGYALVLNSKATKSEVITFNSGDVYNYKKYDDMVSFVSNDKKVKVDNSTVMHFQDKSLLVLKNTVGINLNSIDMPIIFYYNIFKNSTISYNDKKYSIKTIDNGDITFEPLLLRITDNKFLIAGESVRATLASDEVVDFGSYVYIEYVDGSIIKLYNDANYYQTITENANVVVGDITINLKEESISKSGVKYISLSNLVINHDGNIDVLVEEKQEVEKAIIEEPNSKEILSKDDEQIDDSNSGTTTTNNVSGNGSENTENNPGGVINSDGSITDNSVEEVESEDKESKEPVYKVTKLSIDALSLDASFEIQDDDSLISGPTQIRIIENSTSKVVYESSIEAGDLFGYVSYPDLKPDTEYTLTAKAPYKVDDVEYDKTFISKIFRTESLGVYFEKAYATATSIVVDVNRESYSNVSMATLGIFDSDGKLIDYQGVDFSVNNTNRVQFANLDSNTTYMVKLYDILSSGIIVNDGFSQKENISTLKVAPTVGDLEYAVSKSRSAFELSVKGVKDSDYGIKGYRYEVYDVRQNITNEKPIVVVEKDTLVAADVAVDDINIHHGVAYTYKLIVLFNDNEKDIEYSFDLGTTMQIDGVTFPSVRWEESSVTWEQINGTIIVDDPSNTIMSDTYRIVYKNSVDAYETRSITASTDRNAIPINVNYLRANETYTFDVYASINLQDGNPTATETYIGSVKVQTKSPKSLTAVFGDNGSYDDVFSLSFSLANDEEDASFEASTLSSLTFTLYQGSTTEGRVETYKKTIDTDDDEYTSVLKSMFYDASAVIDAKFFNKENSDFKQKTYTLVIDGSYDYTGYDSNIIPITNNVFHFQVNNYIPSLPDPNEAQMVVNSIYNRNADSFNIEYNDDLLPNTLVGYNVIADYDNSSKTGKYVVYHVWRYNPATGEYEMVPGLDRSVNFDASGNLKPSVYKVGDGTDANTLDSDMLRRGNDYYFSYEAYLDMDKDGTAETVYPTSIDSTMVLKSETLSPLKQVSSFVLYPSVSDASTFTWKYKYKDIDHAIYDGKLYGFKNADVNPLSSADISYNEDFQAVTFTGLSSSNILTIRKKEQLQKSAEPGYVALTSQYFYGFRNNLGLRYSLSNDVNKVIISIDNYSENATVVARIAAADVIITPTDPVKLRQLGVKKFEKQDISSGSIVLNYMDISEYISTPVKIEVKAYYDSGNTGFDVPSEYKAIQKGTYDTYGNYFNVSSSSKLVQSSSIYGNLMNVNTDFTNESMQIRTMKGVNHTVSFKMDQTGVVYENNNVLLKEIRTENLASSNNVMQFDYIIPGISLHKNNKIDVTSFLTSVKLNAHLYSTEYSNIRENLVYIDLYETDSNGINSTFLTTLTKNISAFDSPIEINNLQPKTNYYVNFYVYVFNSDTGAYEKIYLYDVNQKVMGVNYHFYTLSEVGVTNIQAELVATSYRNKDLVISFNLDTLVGYDSIDYKLYKYQGGSFVPTDITIPSSRAFFRTMNINVDASPSPNNEIEYEGTYRIVITPMGSYTENGEVVNIELGSYSREFTIGSYEEPYIGISSGKTDSSIFFRVSVNDPSKVIVNDSYTITLLDSNNQVVASTENVSIGNTYKRFTFDVSQYNLVYGEVYKFVVTASADYTNKGRDFTPLTKSRSVRYGGNIYLGTVMLQNMTDDDGTHLNLVFADSFNLNDITSVTYNISSMETGFFLSRNETFSARYEPTTDLYYYSLLLNDDDYLPGAVYTLSLNFYRDGDLIESAEFDYYEGGNG